MDPRNTRMILQTIGAVLTVAVAVVAKLQDVDLTSPTAILGAIALVIGAVFGKASEAPGGVPKWKIPEHLHKQILK